MHDRRETRKRNVSGVSFESNSDYLFQSNVTKTNIVYHDLLLFVRLAVFDKACCTYCRSSIKLYKKLHPKIALKNKTYDIA